MSFTISTSLHNFEDGPRALFGISTMYLPKGDRLVDEAFKVYILPAFYDKLVYDNGAKVYTPGQEEALLPRVVEILADDRRLVNYYLNHRKNKTKVAKGNVILEIIYSFMVVGEKGVDIKDFYDEESKVFKTDVERLSFSSTIVVIEKTITGTKRINMLNWLKMEK